LLSLAGARVLDVGCGGGRNTRWFAAQGAMVVGLDLADGLLAQIRPTMPASVELRTVDILRDPLPAGTFDVVYDSGCFHHIAPHRRITYLERVLPLVRPGGQFGIITFAAEQMEAPSDLDVVATGDTYGGMSFSRDELRTIFASLAPVEIRAVQPGTEEAFAPDFLNAGLFTAPE
jgi:cyclopropane fatty-acyl-phospholipid synthase-like methyltransferase